MKRSILSSSAIPYLLLKASLSSGLTRLGSYF